MPKASKAQKAKNEIRIARLTMLRDMLNNHNKHFKKIKFDMESWERHKHTQGNYKNENKLECSTAACALGSACMFEPFRKQGLRFKIEDKNNNFYNTSVDKYNMVPVYGDGEDFDAGRIFFMISREEAVWLFDPSTFYKRKANYIEIKSITPKVVAKRVQALIDFYGHKNWNGQEMLDGETIFAEDEEYKYVGFSK